MESGIETQGSQASEDLATGYVSIPGPRVERGLSSARLPTQRASNLSCRTLGCSSQGDLQPRPPDEFSPETQSLERA